MLVYRLRHQFLARAALAGDENGRATGGGAGDQSEHVVHPVTGPDQPAETRGVGFHGDAVHTLTRHLPAVLDGVLDDLHDVLVGEWLLDEVEGATLQRVAHGLRRAVGSDHDHRQVRIALLQGLQRVHPVDAGHHDVEQDRIELAFLGRREALGAIGRELHAAPLAHEQGLEHVAHDLLVIHDEDSSPREPRLLRRMGAGVRHGGIGPGLRGDRAHGNTASATRGRDATVVASGKLNVNRVPWPGWLSHSIVPSCSRTTP